MAEKEVTLAGKGKVATTGTSVLQKQIFGDFLRSAHAELSSYFDRKYEGADKKL
jgi:hypothetical protein